jgi:outer membrane protein assembly factor BamB
VNGESVNELYDTKSLRGSFNNPVLVGGYLYGSDRGVLKCIDWSTGVEKWARPGALFAGGKDPMAAGPPPGEGGMIAAGKELLVLDGSGELHLIAAVPDAYRELAHAHVIEGQCWAAPALARGVLYCRNTSGTLSAYDLGSAR